MSRSRKCPGLGEVPALAVTTPVAGLLLTPASRPGADAPWTDSGGSWGGRPPRDSCAVPFTLSISYEKAAKLQPLVFANRGGTPNTWLGNADTLGPLSPSSESLLSLYDQPFMGHGVLYNPLPSSGPSAPDPGRNGGAGRRHPQVRRPGQTQEEVTKLKGSRGKELTEPFLNSQ